MIKAGLCPDIPEITVCYQVVPDSVAGHSLAKQGNIPASIIRININPVEYVGITVANPFSIMIPGNLAVAIKIPVTNSSNVFSCLIRMGIYFLLTSENTVGHKSIKGIEGPALDIVINPVSPVGKAHRDGQIINFIPVGA